MIKTTFKAHPIMVLRLMKPYLFVLILPLIRALVQYLTSGEIDGLLTLELLAFALVVTIAVIGWRSISVTVNDRYLTVKKGILIKSCAKIELSRLSSVSLKRGPLDYLFGSVNCAINTEAGTPKKSDFSFKMYYSDANRLFKLIYGEENPTVIKFSTYKIALLAATTSSAATGIIVGVPVINQASELLGVAISDILFDEINNISSRFTTIFPPIVNVITLILLIAYGVSFFISFFKNVNFKLQSGKNEIDIQSGILVRKRIVFKKSQVNNVCLEQNPLMRLFRQFSMRASIGGFGDDRGEKAVIVPVASHKNLCRHLKIHFPSFSSDGEYIRPQQSKTSLRRFFFVPTVLFIPTVAVGITLSLIFEYFSSLVLFLTVVAVAGIVYYSSVCYRDYKHSKFSLGSKVAAAGSTGFIIRELYCDKNNIGIIKITQTPADRKYNTCKVKLTVRSENADSVRVKNLELPVVKQKIKETFNV